MKILVTGAAGFIGFHLCKFLIERGNDVVGLDNINDYYDINLKYDRLNILGIDRSYAEKYNFLFTSDSYRNFQFVKLNIEDRTNLPLLFNKVKFDKVINLAAQAGVRYSIERPQPYIDTNLVGFANLLECCRHNNIQHLVYASSSSVYGQNKKVPFSTSDKVDHPVSLYAATKKSNELMAYAYASLYGIKTTGLRFFTVYGPWGRPDMAMFLFTDAIINNRPIKVFNKGNQKRDFTYIDDIVHGVVKVMDDKNEEGYSLYNIGNGKPVHLLDFIGEIESQLEKKAQKQMLPKQPGDVDKTWADCDDLKQKFGYIPSTSIHEGVEKFLNWYISYYNH